MRKIITTIFCVLTVVMFSSIPVDGKIPLKKILKEAGDILTTPSTSGTSSTSGTTSATSQYKSPTRRDDGKLRVTTEHEGLKVKVKSCIVDQDDNAIIEFSVENQTNSDSNINFYRSDSEVYDDEGTCYTSKFISYSSSNGQFDSDFSVGIPSGIPVKARMRIKNIDPNASMLKLVNIDALVGGMKRAYIQIRNLPLTREGD